MRRESQLLTIVSTSRRLILQFSKGKHMEKKQLKTAEQALEELSRKGISIAKWARDHGLHPSVVNGVLKGRRKARIGESHKAAVLLGIKEGEIVE